jgi:hypothetical protein
MNVSAWQRLGLGLAFALQMFYCTIPGTDQPPYDNVLFHYALTTTAAVVLRLLVPRPDQVVE